MERRIRKLMDDCATEIIRKGGAGDMSEVEYFLSFLEEKGYEVRKMEYNKLLNRMNLLLNKLERETK